MTREEEMALRELAAGRCVIQKVINVLGPMSLWSKHELEKEILKAVAAEREACAKLLDEMAARDKLSNYYAVAARVIRDRGQP